MEQDREKLTRLRDRLEKYLLKIPGTIVNGDTGKRMQHVSHIRFKGMKGDLLMAALPEIDVSSVSACTYVSPEPSHVLLTMGLSQADTRQSLHRKSVV